MRTPPGINRKVIEDWLNGLSRDEIAQRNGLSTGTISNIIKQTSAENGGLDIDVIRALAKLLKNKEIKLDEIIQGVRIKKRIQDMGLDTEFAEKYIELMDEYCFRKQIEPEKFIEYVDFVVNLPDEERNVQLLVQKIKSLRKEVAEITGKLNNLNNQFREVSKSVREKKKEEKKLLSFSKEYKEIHEALKNSKFMDINPYILLSKYSEDFYKRYIPKKPDSVTKFDS